MDRNSDGVVDKTELHQWIVRSFRMLSREDSDEVKFVGNYRLSIRGSITGLFFTIAEKLTS